MLSSVEDTIYWRQHNLSTEDSIIYLLKTAYFSMQLWIRLCHRTNLIPSEFSEFVIVNRNLTRKWLSNISYNDGVVNAMSSPSCDYVIGFYADRKISLGNLLINTGHTRQCLLTVGHLNVIMRHTVAVLFI